MDSDSTRLAHIEAMRTYPEDCYCKDCEVLRRDWRGFALALFADLKARRLLTRPVVLFGDTLIAGRSVKPLPEADNDR